MGPFRFAHFAGLVLLSSVSALEVGVEILDEKTKEPMGLPLLKVCRPPDDEAHWGPIVIDPLVTFCETSGPGMSSTSDAKGMHSDWKWRNSARRPEGDIPYTYIHLVGPQSSIPMSNSPNKPSSSWFGYGVNSYKDYEASIFEVAREDDGGNRMPQTISYENPLQVGDILEWAGPNGEDVDGDYQLRIGSNIEGGSIRIMRSDKPIESFFPVRLVVTELHETEILAELPPERVTRQPDPEPQAVEPESPREFKLTESQIKELDDLYFGPKRPQPVQMASARGRPESSGNSLGKSILKTFGFGGGKSGGDKSKDQLPAVEEESKEEKKENPRYDDPSKIKGWGINYSNPFKSTKPSASNIGINKDITEDVEVPSTSKSKWSLFGKGKGKGKKTEEVIQEQEVIAPRPITHSRQPIQEEDPESWFTKGTGTVRSLLQRIPTIKIPNILPQKKEGEDEEMIPIQETVIDGSPSESSEEDVEEEIIRPQDNYGSDPFAQGGPGNDVL